MKKNKDNLADPLVRKFVLDDDLEPDLINIPQEFEDMSIDDVTPESYRRSSIRKKFVKNRSCKLLTGYDAWRSFDRVAIKTGGAMPGVATIHVAPVDLIKTFGKPCEAMIFFDATGEYNFEDNNLDQFALFDYRQTDLYHGLNREDSYYVSPKNLARPPYHRKRKYPSVQEFWESTEPMPFRLIADDQSQWRKFRRWLLIEIKKAQERTESYEEMALRKHKDELDICQGNFDEKGKVNHESIACFKWDFTDFMTEQQLKDYKVRAQKELDAKKGSGPI